MAEPLDRITGALTVSRSLDSWGRKVASARPVATVNRPPWAMNRPMAARFASGTSSLWL